MSARWSLMRACGADVSARPALMARQSKRSCCGSSPVTGSAHLRLLRSRHMSTLGPLATALYQQEVARARKMAVADKLLEGPRLFDRACRLMSDGIRQQ